MAENKQTTVIELSWLSIVKVIAVLLACYLLFFLFDVFILLFIVIILASALSPFVEKIKKRLGIPKIIAILLIYIVILLVITFVFYTLIPPVIEQLKNLSDNFPEYSQKISALFSSMENGGSGNAIQSASSAIGNITNTLVKSAGSLFSGLANILIILVLMLFLLLEEDHVRKFLVSLLPISQKVYIIEVSKKISDKLGAWLIGQVSLMAIIGTATTVGLLILSVPYALVLGIIAFFMEAIPTIGPILAAIPAILIAYIDAPWKGVAVLIFATLIQQLENQILVPKIMQKALGVSPFITLVAILIGGKIAGVAGVILAVPTVATISVITKEWPNIRKRI